MVSDIRVDYSINGCTGTSALGNPPLQITPYQTPFAGGGVSSLPVGTPVFSAGDGLTIGTNPTVMSGWFTAPSAATGIVLINSSCGNQVTNWSATKR